jgi:hypothetical protein
LCFTVSADSHRQEGVKELNIYRCKGCGRFVPEPEGETLPLFGMLCRPCEAKHRVAQYALAREPLTEILSIIAGYEREIREIKEAHYGGRG